MKLETKLADAMRQRHKLPEGTEVHGMSARLSVKDIGSDPYKFTARITTDALDRQDEVVLPDGGVMTEFQQSGAIFWNHDYDKPVGFPDKEKRVIRGDNFIEAGGVFMQRPPGFEGEFFPDFVRQFVTQGVAAGINPGVSIGFIPTESRRPTKADIAKFGTGVKLVHSKWKLLEFSIAPVQANHEAVVVAVGKGLIKREIAKAVGVTVPEVVPVAAPPTTPAPRKVIKCTMMIPSASPTVDITRAVEEAVTRQIYKSFGRIYVPLANR